MSMSALPPFVLRGRNRAAAVDAVQNAPEGWVVRIGPLTITSGQNRIFHDMVDDFVRAIPTWHGAKMDKERWKNVLVTSFGRDKSDGAIELVPDLHGDGLVQLRESTSKMPKDRGAALIEFTKQQAAAYGVPLSVSDDQA